jgi:HEPN domain-containing protein
MIDIEKQIRYWQTGASEDWQVAEELVELGRTRHGLFFAHLALEKVLKAAVCRFTDDLPPRIHALLRLADRANLELPEEQRTFLARFDRYQVEGRYPELWPAAPDIETARAELEHGREVFEWLSRQL